MRAARPPTARGREGLWALKATIGAVVTGLIAVRVDDGFRLGRRRRDSRVPVNLEATLVPVDPPGEPVTTWTRDAEAHGRLLRLVVAAMA